MKMTNKIEELINSCIYQEGVGMSDGSEQTIDVMNSEEAASKVYLLIKDTSKSFVKFIEENFINSNVGIYTPKTNPFSKEGYELFEIWNEFEKIISNN